MANVRSVLNFRHVKIAHTIVIEKNKICFINIRDLLVTKWFWNVCFVNKFLLVGAHSESKEFITHLLVMSKIGWYKTHLNLTMMKWISSSAQDEIDLAPQTSHPISPSHHLSKISFSS